MIQAGVENFWRDTQNRHRLADEDALVGAPQLRNVYKSAVDSRDHETDGVHMRDQGQSRPRGRSGPVDPRHQIPQPGDLEMVRQRFPQLVKFFTNCRPVRAEPGGAC